MSPLGPIKRRKLIYIVLKAQVSSLQCSALERAGMLCAGANITADRRD